MNAFSRVFLIALFLINQPFFALADGIAPQGSIVRIQDGIEFFVPKDSPVQFDPTKDHSGDKLFPSSADFTGRFLLTGTYHYGYTDPTAVSGDQDYSYMELYFIPNRKISETLPYWSEDRSANEIRFSNDNEFINAVIPKTDLEKLKSKTVFSVSGPASVWVDNYNVSIDCNYATYSVRFLSIDQLADIILSQNAVNQYGC